MRIIFYASPMGESADRLETPIHPAHSVPGNGEHTSSRGAMDFV